MVYANLGAAPHHDKAFTKLNDLYEQGVEIWISRQILKEYFVGMNRHKLLTDVIAKSAVLNEMRLFTTRFRVADENAELTAKLITLLEQTPVIGRLVYDANIVATMQVYGINRLLTHNVADFNRFSSLITVIPLEAN